MNNCNRAHEEFVRKAQQLFAERGYQNVGRENTLNGVFLLFTQGQISHLVYALPNERYVTTVEVQACWEAQCRLGAKSSSVAAPGRFSEAAFDKAWMLEIELLPVESG